MFCYLTKILKPMQFLVILLHPHSVISFSHIVKGKVQNCLEMHSLITGCRCISPEDIGRFYGIYHLPTLKGRESTLILVKALAVENRRVENAVVHESPVGKRVKWKNPNFEIPKLVVVETQFNFDERKVLWGRHSWYHLDIFQSINLCWWRNLITDWTRNIQGSKTKCRKENF